MVSIGNGLWEQHRRGIETAIYGNGPIVRVRCFSKLCDRRSAGRTCLVVCFKELLKQ
jgi:hypothetical protein